MHYEESRADFILTFAATVIEDIEPIQYHDCKSSQIKLKNILICIFI